MNNANVSMDITQKDRSMPVEPESIRLTLHSDVLHSESLDTISETLQSNKKRKEPSSARPSTSMPQAKKQKLQIIPEKRQIEMVQGTSTPLPKKSKLSRISEFVSTSAIGRIWNDLPPTKSRAHSKIRDSGYSCSVQSPTQSLPDEMFWPQNAGQINFKQTSLEALRHVE